MLLVQPPVGLVLHPHTLPLVAVLPEQWPARPPVEPQLVAALQEQPPVGLVLQPQELVLALLEQWPVWQVSVLEPTVWVVLQPQAPVPLVVALPEQWPVRPQVEPRLVAMLQEQLPPEGLQSVVLLPIAPQCQPRTHRLVKQVLE
jgi:hypothetical protein